MTELPKPEPGNRLLLDFPHLNITACGPELAWGSFLWLVVVMLVASVVTLGVSKFRCEALTTVYHRGAPPQRLRG